MVANPPDGDHESLEQTLLKKPLPSVLAFNLAWEEEPSKSSILKVLLSIQDNINIASLYSEIEDKVEQWYVFRGMVCFCSGHYTAYLRRLPCKF